MSAHLASGRWIHWSRALWRWLRRLSGDDAYERYLDHHAAAHAGEPVLSRRDFHDERQRRKWGGVSRCC